MHSRTAAARPRLGPRSASHARLALALSACLASAGCDASIGGLSSCTKIEDLPFGLHLVLTDPTRLPALPLDLRWSLSDSTGTRGSIASIGRAPADAERSPASYLRAAGELSVTPSLPSSSTEIFARVEVDQENVCVGGASELLHVDLSDQLLVTYTSEGRLRLGRRGRGYALLSLDHDLAAQDGDARAVDARDGRHGYLLSAASTQGAWVLERLSYADGARERYGDEIVSASLPDLRVGPVGRVQVLATEAAGVHTCFVLGPFTDRPIELGTCVLDADGRARVDISQDGRFVLALDEVREPELATIVRIMAIGPTGPIGIRELRVAGRVERYEASPDGKRAAWLSRLSGGAQALGAVDLETARAIFVIPSTGVGREVTDFAWSPKSDQIFAAGDLRIDGREEPFLIESTGLLRLLRNAAPGDPTRIHGIAWSPDGAHVAWIEHIDNASHLRIFELVGQAQRSVSAADESVLDFAWSSDGRELAWRAQIGAIQRLVRSFSDGSGRENIFADAPLHSIVYTWSPRYPTLAIRAGTVDEQDVYIAARGESVGRMFLGVDATPRAFAWSRAFGPASELR